MAKTQAEGKKVLIRRLPPGMTEDEFWAIIGDEWKSGKGKVDWAQYQSGEISTDASDFSRPARCYLHVINLPEVPILAEKVQQLKWEDAKHTANDPALIGPPYLEIAMFQKMPSGKKRTDPRQGTIDSEPEFMKFLESLTATPQSKEADSEQTVDDGAKAETKVTTTPLVEYLKEKKATKAKEAALAKSAKNGRHEPHTKGKEDPKKKGKEPKTEKADKPPEKEKEKEKVIQPVKLLTKKAVSQEVAEAAKAAASQGSSSKPTEEAPPKSRRANISAAAKILQRDLGLSPGSAHRKARQNAAKTDVVVKPESGNKEAKEGPSKATATAATPTPPSKPVSTPATPVSSTPKSQPSEGSRRGRGKGSKQNAGEAAKGKASEPLTTGKSTPIPTPIILKRGEDSGSAAVTSPPAPATAAASTPAPPTGPKVATGGKSGSSGKSASTAPKKAPAPSVTAGATRGFVKHANPSQGVTEPLLKRAMEAFGPVTFVEIDKRKGFAYVDFGNHETLVKAIGASPVSVAQGTVQVLERKETKKVAPAAPAAPAAAPPTQPAAEKKPETQPERSKRGGRGRGRRGGANSGNPEQASSSTPQPETKAASAAPAG